MTDYASKYSNNKFETLPSFLLIQNMAADFLFVLCKENTERLIRYTGYGNSAGFLATRGLMVPGRRIDGDYSEDELTDVDDEQVDVTTGEFEELFPLNFVGIFCPLC